MKINANIAQKHHLVGYVIYASQITTGITRRNLPKQYVPVEKDWDVIDIRDVMIWISMRGNFEKPLSAYLLGEKYIDVKYKHTLPNNL